MQKIMLTDKTLEMMSNPEDVMLIPIWIVEIYNIETATICSLMIKEWIEKVISWECERTNWIKKSNKERVYTNLLECWIIKIEWDSLTFDQDRLAEMNHLWCEIKKEKNKEYVWIWDFETVEKYEWMIKFLKKYLHTSKTN